MFLCQGRGYDNLSSILMRVVVTHNILKWLHLLIWYKITKTRGELCHLGGVNFLGCGIFLFGYYREEKKSLFLIPLHRKMRLCGDIKQQCSVQSWLGIHHITQWLSTFLPEAFKNAVMIFLAASIWKLWEGWSWNVAAEVICKWVFTTVCTLADIPARHRTRARARDGSMRHIVSRPLPLRRIAHTWRNLTSLLWRENNRKKNYPNFFFMWFYFFGPDLYLSQAW